MTRNSKIEWTDHTFNPWVGCTKISPGCDHCYAESWAKRSGMVEWGGARRRTSAANWKQPLKWNAAAAQAGRRDRVFCASLADVFDNDADQKWRVDLFELIRKTPHLDWLLLTKRIGNAKPMLGRVFYDLGFSYGLAGLTIEQVAWPWPNVWIGATVVNQDEADRDIPKLLDTCAAARFLSCEPLLGPINLTRVVYPLFKQRDEYDPYIAYDTLRGHMIGPDDVGLPKLNWVIAGGESGPHARPMHPDWVRSLRDQCIAAGVPFLFKQWGAWLPSDQPGADNWGGEDDSCFHDWSDDLYSIHLHKKDAGRELDGRTWDQFPGAA